MNTKENSETTENQNSTDLNSGGDKNSTAPVVLQGGENEKTIPVTPLAAQKEYVPEGCVLVPGENGKQDAIKWTLPEGSTQWHGKEAFYRKLVGFNIRMAQRAAGDDETMGNFALISQGLSIGGTPVTVEELDMMPEDLISDIMSKRQVFTSGRKK